MPAEQITRGDGQADAEQGRGRPRPAPGRHNGPGDHDRTQKQGLPARVKRRSTAPGRAARAGCAEASDGAAGKPSKVRSWRITIIAPTPHENPETTACGTFATYRPSRSTQKIIMKTDAARQTLAAPPTPLSAHGRRDERHGGAGRPADQHGVATQERRDRRGQDRREQAELGRQAHQPRQGQAVGKRDQGGDEAPRGVARQVAPAVAVSLVAPACRPALAARRLGIRHSSRARRRPGTSPSPPGFRS